MGAGWDPRGAVRMCTGSSITAKTTHTVVDHCITGNWARCRPGHGASPMQTRVCIGAGWDPRGAVSMCTGSRIITQTNRIVSYRSGTLCYWKLSPVQARARRQPDVKKVVHGCRMGPPRCSQNAHRYQRYNQNDSHRSGAL
jgi:hypothetical protein